MTARLWPEQLKGAALDRDHATTARGPAWMEGQELSLGPVQFNVSTRHPRGDPEWAIGHEFVAQEGSFVAVRDQMTSQAMRLDKGGE